MKPITGSIVALVTPMHDDGSVDYDALRRLIDWHVDEGTQCIGVVGTTGESPTVTVDEHCEIIRVAVEHARGRVPVMAGTGGNATAEAIELSRFALKVGADCTLSVVPYYNKPSQEGIYRHFKAIAEAVDIPMVVYNVPGRTVADMQPETVLRLAQVPGIVGVKEASGDIVRAAALIRDVPAGFSIYSGNDDSAIALMLLGGHGTVSVTANVAPRADAGALHRGARRQRARGGAAAPAAAAACTTPCSSSRARRRPSGRSSASAAAARRCGCRSCRSAKRAAPRSRRRCATPASRERGDPRPERANARGLSQFRAAPPPGRPPSFDGDFQSDPFPFLSSRGRVVVPRAARRLLVDRDMLAGDKVDYRRRRPRARRRSKCRPT